MATIGNLDMNIRAFTHAFDAGINKARKSLFSFSKTSELAQKKVLGFADSITGRLVGVLGLGAMVVSLNKARGALDELAKTADRIGIATEKLSGLTLAASQTGASSQELGNGLRDMTRRISEAAQGSGEAAKALAELGLNAKQLNDLAPDQQFSILADAMSKVTNEGDKVRLAYDIMGRSGTKLINTLNLGSKGLAEMQAEAERLGMTLSREELARVEAMNDALDKLGRAFSALSGEILINIAPAATRAIEMIVDINAAARGASRPGPTKGVEGHLNTPFGSIKYGRGSTYNRAFNKALDVTAGQLTMEEQTAHFNRLKLARAEAEGPALMQQQMAEKLGKTVGDSMANVFGNKLPNFGAAFAKGFVKVSEMRRPGAFGPMGGAESDRIASAIDMFVKLREPMGRDGASLARGPLTVAERGSREAFDAIANARRNKEGDVQEKMLDVEEQQRDLLQKIDVNLATPKINVMTA